MGSRFLTFRACTLLAPLKLSRHARDGARSTPLEVVASTALAQPPAASRVQFGCTCNSACLPICQEYRQQPKKLSRMSGACGATDMAEPLELFVRMIAAPGRRKTNTVSPEASIAVGIATDINIRI